MFSIINHNLVHFQGRVPTGKMRQKTMFPLKEALMVVLPLKKGPGKSCQLTSTVLVNVL